MKWIDTVLCRLSTATRPNRKARRASPPRLSVTRLEDRTVPTTLTWTGAIDANWGTVGNWSGGGVGDNVPNSSDDVLIFAAAPVRLTSTNNITSLSVDAIQLSSSGYNVSGTGVALGTGLTDTTATGTNVVALALGGAGAVTKSGASTLVLTGTNTYTGATTINAGALQVDGAIASAVALTGGTLSGSGTLGGSGVTGTGAPTIDPGSVGGPGILTYANATGLTLPATSTLHVDLNGATVGTGYDQLRLTNGAALFNPNGATLDIGLGYLPAVNTSFQIVSQTFGSPITGRFNGISQFGSVVSGPVTFSVGYFNSGVILTVTAVNTQTSTWDGGGTTNNWSDAANWAGDTVPAQFAALVFPAGAPRPASVNDLAAGSQFTSITIAGAGYTITGNAVTLQNGISTTYAAGTSTFGLDTALTATQTVDVAAGGTLNLSGAISGGGFGLTKTGGGMLDLTGGAANTYTGATTLNAGVIQLGKVPGLNAFGGALIVGDGAGTGDAVKLLASNQIPDASAVTLNEGATFDLGTFLESISALTAQGATVTTGTGAVLTIANSLTTAISVNHTPVVVQGAGVLDLGGNATFAMVMAHDGFNNGTLNVDTQISTLIQNGGIAKSGGGILGLSGANTYAGATSVTGGAIQVQSASALGTTAGGTTVASGASVYFKGPLSVAEDFSIAGTGFISSGALTAVSGAAALSGAVGLTGSSQVGAAGGATLTINGVIDDAGSTYGLNVVNAPDGRTVLGGSNLFDGPVAVLSGFLRAANANAFGDPASAASVTAGAGTTLELAGGITIPATKTLAISGTPVTNFSKVMSVSGDNTIQGNIGITGGNNVAFDVAGGTTLTVAGVISGSVDFDKNNTGTLVLTGMNTNSGNVNVSDGTLIVNGSLATSTAVFVDGILGGSGTVPAVTISSIGTLAPGNSPGTLHTGALAFTDSGSTYSAELNGATLGTQYDQADVTGTVTLAGATLSLSLGYGPAIGTTYTIINNDGTDAVSGTFNGLAQGGTLTIGNVTLTISYAGGTGNDVVLTVTDVTYTWTGADNSGRDWTIGGNWVGGVAPTAGSRLVFPTSPVRTESINDFASNTSFYSVTIAGSGYDIYGNGLTLTNGITATFTAGNSAFGLDTALTATETVDVATGGTLDMTGAISGTGFGVTKTGGGTLRYSGAGANTYTGATTLNAGIIELGKSAGVNAFGGNLVVGDGAGSDAIRLLASNQIPDAAAVTLNEGATFDLGTFLESINALTLQGATVTTGTGAVLTIATSLTTAASANHVISTVSGAGGLALNQGSNGTFTFAVADDTALDADLRISAAIATITNSAYISKAGAGTLALSGTNTFGSTITFYANAGALQLESSGALGGAVASANTGGAITFSGPNLSFGEDFYILTATPGANSFDVLSGTTTLTGNFYFYVDARFGAESGATLVINDALYDAAFSTPLNVTIGNGATGRTVLGADNSTFFGNLDVLAGFLQAANANAFGDAASAATVTVQSGASLELSGGIVTPATKGIVLTGPGANSGTSAKIANLDSTNSLLGSVALQDDETVDVASGSALTLAGNIGETGGSHNLTKEGAGTLTLSGTGGYTGITIIDAGTLVVDGNFGATAGVSVNGGTTLSGTGTVGMPVVMSGGTVAPGNPTGALNTGPFNTTGGSVVSFDINGATAGTQYDQINATGGVYLYGATLNLSVGYTAAVGTPFTLISNVTAGSVGGTFAGLPEGATLTVGSATYTISYAGGDGNDVVLTVVSRIDTWTGLGGDNNWSTAANWASGVAPVAGDDLVFPAGAARMGSVNDFVAGTGFTSITIAGAGFSFTGNAIQLDNGVTTTYASGTSTIALATNLTGNPVVDVAAGGTLTFSGVVSGPAAVTKAGAGVLLLGGADAYTGATTVTAGTLLVNGSIALSSGVGVASGATLGGSGTAPAVTVGTGGTLAPGNGPGVLSTGALAFTSGATYRAELNGATVGTQYDQTAVTGTVALAGATLALSLGYGPAIGTAYTIINNDGIDAVSGTFNGLAEGATFVSGGTVFRISYIGGDGNDVTVTAFQPTISINSVSAAEGNTGTTAFTFTVTLSGASAQTVTVAYTTADGTATAGTDYTAASGTVTFAPGVTSQTVTVFVTGDATVEADETFVVTLSAPVNASIAAGTGTGAITNDDVTAPTQDSRLVLGAMGGMVQLIDPATGQPGAPVPAYTGFLGEVRVASGDVDGDGVADLITGAGAGGMGGHVKVFDGATGAVRFSFLAFDGFAGGVFVASGDVNGDGFDDIVVSAGPGAGPHVKVFSGKDGSLLMSFFAYDTAFLGGVRVAVGDVDGDGFADIVTGNGAGAPANVKVFSGNGGALLKSFLAYDAGFTGGVYVGAGDVDGDGFADIVTGSGAGAPGGHVKVFSGRDFTQEASFLAYDAGFVGGVRVSTGLVDGATAILAGSGPGAHGHFKAFDLAGDDLLSLLATGADRGGVYVA